MTHLCGRENSGGIKKPSILFARGLRPNQTSPTCEFSLRSNDFYPLVVGIQFGRSGPVRKHSTVQQRMRPQPDRFVRSSSIAFRRVAETLSRKPDRNERRPSKHDPTDRRSKTIIGRRVRLEYVAVLVGETMCVYDTDAGRVDVKNKTKIPLKCRFFLSLPSLIPCRTCPGRINERRSIDVRDCGTSLSAGKRRVSVASVTHNRKPKRENRMERAGTMYFFNNFLMDYMYI